MFEKTHREDKGLEARPQRRAEHDADEASANTKPSALWLAEGSAREEAVGHAGTRDGARELPYRGELEHALGTDLSHVKAYAGPHASAAAGKLGAEAYAMRDAQAVVFGDANPSKELVAHEVVHTLQHGSGAVSQDESEADTIGAKIAAGEHVERGAIKSGGGKVRKKSNLAAVFDEFLKGAEKDAEARYGDDALEDPSVGSFTPDGKFESTKASDEVALTGLGFSKSSTEVDRQGTADRVQEAVDEARVQVAKAELSANLTRMGTMFDKMKLETELHELENLDQALVAIKTDQVRGQIRAADKRIAACDAEIAGLDRTKQAIDKLDAEIPKGLAGVPQLLEDAEKSFRGTETTRKRSFGFDLLAGKVSQSISVERTEVDDLGKHTSGMTKGSETKIGGGIARTDTTSRKRSSGGKTVETGATTTSSLKMGEDGSYGYGKEKKLSGAIENSFGKATGGAGLNGGFTTNIIQIPGSAGEPLYAVVTTINVGLAVEAGLEKEADVAKRQKVKAAISAKGGIEAQITQTHVLDQAHVKDYLRYLDKVANGSGVPNSDKPELNVLFKAMRAAENIDELMLGAASTLGSSDAAKTMAVDESVELTTKVTGEVEGTAGLGPLGASGGTKGELYRSLKIGRVTGKPGQELIEVAVTFGTSSDVHGALTGSALGVTASVGGKAWSAEQEAVTFRLDPSATDYAALYDEVVGSHGPADLAELRKSLRFQKHVHNYATKRTTGDEGNVGISGGLFGMRQAETSQRTDERGIDADGKFSAAAEGQQGIATGFSVGPLELLRRSQVDAARFELADGVGTLDVSERTSTASVGQWDWSLAGLVTAESPAKAAEKALLATTERLSGFLLDEGDLDRLVEIAREDADVWSAVADHVGGGRDDARAVAWETLRRTLSARNQIPNDPQVPLEVARILHLGNAVADFMAVGEGAKGQDYVYTLLRNPRAVGGRDANGIGVAYEFNADVSSAAYKDVRKRCKGLELHLAQFVADREQGLEPGMAYLAQLQVDLAKLLKAVEESYEFREERSRIEMIGELRGFAAEFPRIARELERKCTGIEVPAAQVAAEALADEKARVTQLERSLEKSKLSETWLLERMERRAGQRDKHAEATELVANLQAQYESHVFLVKQLRAAYEVAKISEGSRRVSSDRRAERKDLDIDGARFTAAYDAWLAGGDDKARVWGSDRDDVVWKASHY